VGANWGNLLGANWWEMLEHWFMRVEKWECSYTNNRQLGSCLGGNLNTYQKSRLNYRRN